MKVAYTVTVGPHGISIGRTQTQDGTVIGNYGFEQYEMPEPGHDGLVLLTDVIALINDKGYRLTGMWAYNELDGYDYMQVDVEKIGEE